MIKAKIIPLEGKYYGTIVQIEFKGQDYNIKLWNNDDCVPSERQLQDWGYTQEQYNLNSPVKFEGLSGEVYTENVRDYIHTDLMCDGHYESKNTYELAKIIEVSINRLNGLLESLKF